jgi:hypothetical protein
MVVTHSSNTPKKWQTKICIDFKKLNVATYPLPFIDEVLNIVAWYEGYFF